MTLAEHRLHKIVMMGTGPFAVPTFLSLLSGPGEVVLLVTRPARPGVGKKSAPESPMRRVALERGLPVWDPEDVNDPDVIRRLADLGPDLLVVCDYGQILAPALLAVPRWGAINLHGSLLPRYRGAAPINWAIYRGETETGVSVIHLTPGLDAGPVLTRRRLPIADSDDAESLEPQLAGLGEAAVREAIELLANWDRSGSLGEIQDPQQVTRARRLRKEYGAIRWGRSARQIFNQIRAFKPWPGSYTYWQRSGKPAQRWIIERAVVTAKIPEIAETIPWSDRRAGQVVVERGRVWVATGNGWLELERIQPEGKRVMPVAELIRGTPLKTGDQLGEPGLERI